MGNETESDSDYDIPTEVTPSIKRNPIKELHSQPYFHGLISRRLAESLVQKDGDFLLRDSISMPGEFILSCHWSGNPLHFQINKLVLPADETLYGSTTKTLYQFEEEQFQSIADLIDFYRTHLKPITVDSKCRIQNPVAHEAGEEKTENAIRSPLQVEIENNYALVNRKLPPIPSKGLQNLSLPSKINLAQRPLPQLPYEANIIPKTLSLSQRVLLSQTTRRLQRKFGSDTKLCPSHNNNDDDYSIPGSPLIISRSTVDLAGSDVRKRLHLKDAPQKPRRAPSLKNKPGQKPKIIVRNKENGIFKEILPEEDYEENIGDDYCEIDYAEMDFEDGSPSPPDDRNPVTVPSTDLVLRKTPELPDRKPPTDFDRDSACVPDFSIYDSPNPIERVIPSPNVMPREKSGILLDNFASSLLPKENKPLNMDVLDKIQSLLLKTQPYLLANNITKSDWKFIENYQQNSNIATGIGLVILPHGGQLRNDLNERSNCLRMFVITSIVKCTKQDSRLELLVKWIQIAEQLRALGNLYSFGSVADGLTSRQILSLSSLWSELRSSYTDVAVTFDNRLRPFNSELLKSVPSLSLDTNEQQTLPYFQAVLKLFEVDNYEKVQSLDWLETDGYFGLDSFLFWLQLARSWQRLKRDSTLDFDSVEPLLQEMFSTEFQLTFLWGSRGATAPKHQRYAKFEQLLMLLAERIDTL